MMERVLPYIAIAVMASLMAWAAVAGLDREMDIREAQARARLERMR